MIYHVFLPMIAREFQWVLKVTDRVPDGLTDESNDKWMERNFPGFRQLGNLVHEYSSAFSL